MTDATPQRQTPVRENWEGDNHAYRGVVDHGVPDTVEPSDIAGYDGSVAVPTVPEPQRPDPIDVRVVQESSREIKDWRMHTVGIPPWDDVAIVPVLLLGRNDRRTKVTIQNGTHERTGGAPPDNQLWICRYPTAVSDGIPVGAMVLNAGKQITIATTEEIFAFSWDVNMQYVDVLEEFTVHG